MTYRVAIELGNEDICLIRGDTVTDIEDYLTVCAELWHRLMKVHNQQDQETT